MQRTILQNNLT